jgi:hypothetical protein
LLCLIAVSAEIIGDFAKYNIIRTIPEVKKNAKVYSNLEGSRFPNVLFDFAYLIFMFTAVAHYCNPSSSSSFFIEIFHGLPFAFIFWALLTELP